MPRGLRRGTGTSMLGLQLKTSLRTSLPVTQAVNSAHCEKDSATYHAAPISGQSG